MVWLKLKVKKKGSQIMAKKKSPTIAKLERKVAKLENELEQKTQESTDLTKSPLTTIAYSVILNKETGNKLVKLQVDLSADNVQILEEILLPNKQVLIDLEIQRLVIKHRIF